MTAGNPLPVASLIVPDISRVCAIAPELSRSNNVNSLKVLIAKVGFMMINMRALAWFA